MIWLLYIGNNRVVRVIFLRIFHTIFINLIYLIRCYGENGGWIFIERNYNGMNKFLW